MATQPRRIQTPGEPVNPSMPPDAGEPDAVELTPEEMAEQLAQLKELTQRQAEQLQAVQDAQAAREANSQAGRLRAEQRTSELSQEQALVEANRRGRSVLSRDGWVAPTKFEPLPANLR